MGPINTERRIQIKYKNIVSKYIELIFSKLNIFST